MKIEKLKSANIAHIFKTLLKYISIKLQSHLAFRTDALFNLLRGFLETGFTFIFFEIIYRNVNSIAGWSKGEVFVLSGMVLLLQNIYATFTGTGAVMLSFIIRYGRLEKYLLRPFPTPLLIAFRNLNFHEIYRIFPNLFLIIYGFKISGVKFNPLFIIPAILSFMLSYLIYLLMNFILSELAFWFTEVNNLFWITYDFYEFAKYPEKIYKGIFRKIFITILPFILLANYPTMILLGKTNFNFIIYQFILFTFFFLFSNILWKKGIKRYEGTTV
jgi:ABC-2 type transport system permease protein